MNDYINMYVVFAAGLLPLVLGFIWYNKATFGNIWLKESGLSLETAQKANMLKLSLLTLVFGILAAMAMMVWVIHQMHYMSVLQQAADAKLLEDKTSSLYAEANKFFADHGTKFRTFKHGAFHGFLGGIFLALPIIGMSAIYERKSWKYILIHVGFWAVCFMLMGGIICQWA